MSERMQSLLSRAVEDQLTEQRQLAGALTEVRTQLARLGAQLNAMQTGPAGSSDQVEKGLAGLATDLREAVRLLSERLDVVARQVGQRGHDLAELKALVGELKSSVEEHTAALDGMTSGLAALPAFGERIDALQNGLGGLHERLRGVEELSAAAGGVQAQAQAHETALRELRQAFTGVAARAAQLPGRDDIEAIVGRSADGIETLGNRLGRIEASLPSLLERLNELSDQMTQHGESLTGLQTPYADVPAVLTSGTDDGERAAALAESLASLHRRLDDLHQRDGDTTALEALQGRLDALHEGLFGADGLHAQLTAQAPAEPTVDDGRVTELVAQAVEDSERRLADHIDQAVLALAEALLRRRAPRSTTRTELWAAATAPAVDDALVDDADDDDADDDGADDDEPVDNGAVIDDDVDVDEDEDENTGDQDGDAATQAARWQTPVVAAPVTVEPTGKAAEPPPAEKRKPWWRPSS